MALSVARLPPVFQGGCFPVGDMYKNYDGGSLQERVTIMFKTDDSDASLIRSRTAATTKVISAVLAMCYQV